jgi:hypothetical protein
LSSSIYEANDVRGWVGLGVGFFVAVVWLALPGMGLAGGAADVAGASDAAGVVDGPVEATLENVDDEATYGEILTTLEAAVKAVQPSEEKPRPVRSDVRLRVVASPPSSSLGQLKTCAMYGVRAGGVRAGLAAAKDKGESRLDDSRTYYVGKTWSRGEVLAGKFALRSGHGLVFSGTRAGASYADSRRVGRGDFGLRPATASEENSALEGVGLSLKTRGLDLLVALSRSKRDALLGEAGSVKSLPEGSTHVTAAELAGRDALREDLIGMACRFRHAGLEVTMSLSCSSLSRSFMPARLAWPQHRARIVGGADVSMERGGTRVFAEAATADGSFGGVIAGLAFDGPAGQLLVLARSYGTGCLGLHSAPYGSYSGVGTGERGMLVELKVKPVSGREVTIRSDLHARTDAGGAASRCGSETQADAAWQLGGVTLSLGERFTKNEETPWGSPGEIPASASASVGGTAAVSRLRSRLDAEFRPVRELRVRLRYEALSAQAGAGESHSRSRSDLMRADFRLDLWKPVALSAGCYVFGIDDWAARIYQYETGVPYYPSLELLKSDGSRWYAGVSFDVKRLGRLAAKYGRTLYKDGEERSEFLATYIARI